MSENSSQAGLPIRDDLTEQGDSSVPDSLTSSARWRTPRGEAFSQASIAGVVGEPIDVQKMDTGELADFVANLSEQLDVIKQEHTMYENYCRRLEERDPNAFTIPNPNAHLIGLDRAARRRRRKHAKPVPRDGKQLIRLTVEQKTNIAEKEAEYMKKKLTKSRERFEALLEMEQAKHQDARMRAEEVRKMDFDFQRDVTTNGINQFTGKIMSEKVCRYFEDKQRKRDILIAKYQLKLNSMRQQKRRVDLQLQQKEDAGGSMKVVDFEKLRIQNRGYRERINQSVQRILKLRLVAAKSVHNLQAARKELSGVVKEQERVTQLIAQRDDLLRQIEKDLEKTMREAEDAKVENLRQKRMQEDYRVPPVMSYITTNSDLYELQKKSESWRRKNNIAEMNVTSLYPKAQRLRRQFMDLKAAVEQARAQGYIRGSVDDLMAPERLPPLAMILQGPIRALSA